jgi:hypothetical protein
MRPVSRDECYCVLPVNVTQPIHLVGAELGNTRKKTKPQILRADVGQKLRVQGRVFRAHRPDQARRREPFRALRSSQSRLCPTSAVL